jgi:AcrR family transcriptional regulator
MSDAAVILERAPPRRRDAQATRAALLEAAKAQFAALGYDSATLREIAAAAGADVALIKRYFGGKEGLFTEALKASIGTGRWREWDRASFPREVAAMMAGSPHGDEGRTQSFQFLLRAATSPATAPMLNVAVQERFLAAIRGWLGGGESLQSDVIQARARVLAAVFIGFLVERLIRDEPLAGREREVFIDRAAAILQTLVEAP